PFRCCSLGQYSNQNNHKCDRCDQLGMRRTKANQHSGQSSRYHAGFANPTDKQQLFNIPLGAPVWLAAQKDDEWPGNKHKDSDSYNTANPELAEKFKIDLAAEQNKYEHAHDKRGITNKIFKTPFLNRFNLKTKQ